MHPQRNDPYTLFWITPITGDSNICCTRCMPKNRNGDRKQHRDIFTPVMYSKPTVFAKHLMGTELGMLAGWENGSCTDPDISSLERQGSIPSCYRSAGSNRKMWSPPPRQHPRQKCVRGETMNPSTMKYCYKCGRTLDMKTAIGMDEKRSSAMAELMDLIPKPPVIVSALNELPEKDGKR